jgi:hypothetical protein
MYLTQYMTQKAAQFHQNHKIHRLKIDSALESAKNSDRGPKNTPHSPRLPSGDLLLLLETRLIFTKEPLEIIKEHPVKRSVFRMTLAVDPCHGREDDSQNGPDCRKRPCSPDVP